MIDWHNWLHSLIGLIVIVNPLLAIPAFTAMTEGDDDSQRRATANRTALTVASVLSLAALAGSSVLHFFSIDISSFRVGGGILILLMAISMLHAKMSGTRHTDEEAQEASTKEQVGVVPLGIPLLAGPGAISTVIIYAHGRDSGYAIGVLIAEIWLVAGLVWLSLSLGERLARVLGKTGINVATRIMGLLLAAIAVQFITHGLQQLLPGLA
jgi:multiple antibiotic resistance protein